MPKKIPAGCPQTCVMSRNFFRVDPTAVFGRKYIFCWVLLIIERQLFISEQEKNKLPHTINFHVSLLLLANNHYDTNSSCAGCFTTPSCTCKSRERVHLSVCPFPIISARMVRLRPSRYNTRTSDQRHCCCCCCWY